MGYLCDGLVGDGHSLIDDSDSRCDSGLLFMELLYLELHLFDFLFDGLSFFAVCHQLKLVFKALKSFCLFFYLLG